MSAHHLLAFAFLASCAASAQRDEIFPPQPELAVLGRQLSFGAGQRSYSDDAFGDLQDQVALALDYCEPMELGALRLEGGIHYSYDEADSTVGGQPVRLQGQVLELSVGANFSHLFGRLRPYVGAGGALLFLNLRGRDEDIDVLFDDDDTTVGAYAKAGLAFQLTRSSHLGVEFRHFEGGDVSFDGTELETSYDQFLFVFGTSFK